MSYVSSVAVTATLRNSLQTAQKQLADGQAEVASGTYADLGATLGSSSGVLLSLNQQKNRLSAYTDGNSFASTRLSSTSTTLSSLQTSATTFGDSLTAAITAGGSTSGLQDTAGNNLTAMIAGLNTSVGSEAVFGGINSGTAPMTAYAAGSASKAAVDAAFQATFGFSQTSAQASTITPTQMTSFLNSTFANLFSASSYSSTWSAASSQAQTTEISPDQTVTTSVSANDPSLRSLAEAYTMVSEFGGSNFSTATQQAVAQAASATVSNAVDGLTNLQTTVGISQNAISSANDQITAQSDLFTSQASGMQDVDVYALNTHISNLQTQIQASYELTSTLKQLSLVNYLS